MSQNSHLQTYSIHRIRIILNCHATESIDKVRNSIKFLFPEYFNMNSIISNLSGGFGNPISTLRIEIDKPEIANFIFSKICELMPEEDKSEINSNFLLRIDSKGTLFLRLKKYLLCRQDIRLTNGSDSVRIEIKFKIANPKRRNKIDIEDLRKELMRVNFITN